MINAIINWYLKFFAACLVVALACLVLYMALVLLDNMIYGRKNALHGTYPGNSKTDKYWFWISVTIVAIVGGGTWVLNS